MPRRLKSGSGHHRLGICGPSNGRHKIAYNLLDFFAMLRSLFPSAIDDALDTLYEPSVVFSQFLGPASMTCLFPSPFLASSSCLVFSYFLFLSFPFLSLSVLPLSCLVFYFVFPFLYLFFFSCFLFLIDVRLSCVCVVIGTTCNIYVVVFLGGESGILVGFSRRE